VKRSTETLAVFLLAFAIASCALLSEAPPPDTAAREAYRSAVTACAVYELAPGEFHRPDTDKACRSLRLVCSDADRSDGAGGSP